LTERDHEDVEEGRMRACVGGRVTEARAVDSSSNEEHSLRIVDIDALD